MLSPKSSKKKWKCPQILSYNLFLLFFIFQWHLGFYAKEFTPTQRGFDTFYGFYAGQGNYWDHAFQDGHVTGLDLHRDTPVSYEVIHLFVS